MTEIHLEELGLTAVRMELESRATLGSSDRAPASGVDRVSVGKPICVPLDSTSLDRDGLSFVEGRPNSSFWLLGVSCSFRADARAPIDRAWLEVELNNVQPPQASAPIAWSMEPLSSEDLVQVGRKAALDGFLKLKSELVPLEIGSSASIEETEKQAKRVPFLEAHREGTSQPCWFFSRTEVAEVRGVHRLRAVIETRSNSISRAKISVGAVIRLKHLGMFTYKDRLDEIPDHQLLEFGDLQI